MGTAIPFHAFKKNDTSTNSLKVERMETIHDRSKGNPNVPHRHNYYTVVWVKSGTGHHLIDFNIYPLQNNKVFFVGPGQIHQVVTGERPEGWVITFDTDFLAKAGIPASFLVSIHLFRQYNEAPPVALDKEAVGRLATIMSLLENYVNEPIDYQSEALGAALKLFLIECVCQVEEVQGENDQDGPQLLFRFKQMVEEKFESWHKVSDYAGALAVTPKHLNHVVKTNIGCTAKDYIIDRIMTEAKRVLIHSDQSVKQIAIELGFSEPLHFNSFFKKRTNQAPLIFRSVHQVN